MNLAFGDGRGEGKDVSQPFSVNSRYGCIGTAHAFNT